MESGPAPGAAAALFRMLEPRYVEPAMVARGGMGLVLSARDIERGRRVAVKLPATDLSLDPVLIERFEREARALQAVSHPNIIRILDVHRARVPFFTMELVNAPTLRDAFEGGARPGIARGLKIGYQVCAALAHLHRLGITHRDVKPDNLLLLPDDTVKLVDLGLACALDWNRITNTASIVGTPRYIAPECLNGSGVEPRIDVFSLGVVLVELLAGRYPFQAAGVYPQLFGDIPSVSALVPEASPALAELLADCARTDPERRIASCAEVLDRLAAELRELGESVPAGTGGVEPPLAPAPAPDTCAFPADAHRYRPTELLGSGGFGAVWIADDVKLGRTVVIKRLRVDTQVERSVLKRFQAEARLTSALSHPSIVKVLDHGADPQGPWIAYEYLRGRSLQEVIDSGPVPWRRAVAIAEQLADALAAAHARGILHRDIKPANIVEVERDRITLIDFGLAKFKQDVVSLTRTGAVVGTPAYMAPELLAGGLATPRSDIYALGLVMAQLLAGRRLRLGEGARELLEGEVPEGAAAWPRELARTVLRAAAVRSEDRFESACALLDALRASGAPATSASHARRRAMLAVGAVLAAGLAVMRLRTPPPPPTVATATASAVARVRSPRLDELLRRAVDDYETSAATVMEGYADLPRLEELASPLHVDPRPALELARRLRSRSGSIRATLEGDLEALLKELPELAALSDGEVGGLEQLASSTFNAWWLEMGAWRIVARLDLTVVPPGAKEEQLGLTLSDRCESAAIEALTRIAAGRATRDVPLARVLKHLRQRGSKLVTGEWGAETKALKDLRVRKARSALGKLGGQAGAVAVLCFDSGAATLPSGRRAALVAARAALAAFIERSAPRDPKLEELLAQMDAELAGHRAN